MKKYISILVCCLAFCLVNANKIAYMYDAAGNRISRQYVIELPPLNAPMNRTINLDTVKIEKKLGEPKITVYPNPTKGALSVEILGSSPDETFEMKLYNPQGELLKNQTTTEGKNQVVMTSYAAGWYLLKVYVGKTPILFKIIKE